MIVFFNNEYLPKDRVAISPDDRGFLFGDGAYEVVRSYRGKLFRLQEHLTRLARSLRELFNSLGAQPPRVADKSS